MTATPSLAVAEEAIADGDWPRAFALLAPEVVAGDAAGLELRATAAYGAGELEASIAAWEDVCTLHTAAGDAREAARAAAMIAMFLMIDTGLMSAVRGWLRRAERLLSGQEEAPATALIAMVRSYERFMCGDMEAARAHAELAIELGTRLGVQPAVVVGRVGWARTRIFEGAVDEGLELLDEVGALLMSGAVDPLTTGMMYCELICAAQGLSLHERAREWTDLMERWRHGAAMGGIHGRCRVHRAELLRISGPCDRAEQEALDACAELRPWMRREFGWPLVELGTIRLRKGDLAGAEEAFTAAHEHAWSPQPGFARLRLAQGDVVAAASMIADAIAHPSAVPSKEQPPFGDLRLAPLLDAQAEIAQVAGDATTAAAAAAALASIARTYSSRGLDATADLAAARAALLAGDLDGADAAARSAIEVWTEVGAPFETAVARLVLGEVHQRAGHPSGARMEWRAAQSAFAAFGAVLWAERAAQLGDDAPDASAPLARAANAGVGTFRAEGGLRTIALAGTAVTLRDLKGFRYLERLLTEPRREFHALDLLAVERGSLPRADRAEVGSEALPSHLDAALPVLDEQAREAYRRRLADIEEDIADAENANDLGRVELAQRDREYLIAELRRSMGLGGRHRVIGSAGERARTSVTRSLRYALRRLDELHPAAAAHLQTSLCTGTYCSYAPDPGAEVTWST
ncbi:MAG: hypothetical protein ACSLFP_03560 [Acidimicrobiales bacterium]